MIEALAPLGVQTMDISGDEMAKTHSRYLAGGRPGELAGEKIIRFEFPEYGGSLERFLGSLRDGDFGLTMLHYRNHGGQVGKVLAGISVPSGTDGAFYATLDELGYPYTDETTSEVYRTYMR